ncbi:ATP-binding protein [Sphingorhabdus sp.]|uniref:ATP-binding protein n=1 Tax=Sphingorhabdus sp. TaxID=1902408 RepID=UPI003BB157FD
MDESTRSQSSSPTTSENEAEYRQARSRILNVIIAVCYLYFSGIGEKLSNPAVTTLVIYVASFFAFTLAVFLHTRLRPGYYAVRRLLAMMGDFGSLTYVMLLGQTLALPLYVFIVWVTLGNGMRFGSRYLIIASAMAQLSLLALYILGDFWRQQPYLMATFSMLALVLPAYAMTLLRQTAEARDSALVAMQAKSRFLAHASHDLRQPIHSIGYYLSLLRTTRGKPDREQLIDRIERALGSVSRLFKSLLDIAQLDSGTVAVNSEVVSLQALLSDLVQQNEQSAQWNEVELRFVQTSAWVLVDPTLLTTMTQNLLSNAIKYARGSKVLIGVRRQGKSLAIEVHDAGIGIDEQHMPHIFDEFYRAHVEEDHDAEGVGLGLSIVNKLAQLSGLTLTIKSRRGAGTVAGIYDIPISAKQPEPKPQLAGDSPRPMAGYRVILIEDNIDVLHATCALLQQWGCEVQSHSTIPDRFGRCDLIIADYDLGNQELGTDAIRAIRAKLGSTIPAILMTGYAEAVVSKQTIDEGIQVLAKPVPPAMLRSTVSTLRIALRNQTPR